MDSSQTRQGALRPGAALLLLAVLAAPASCGSQTAATTQPTATVVVTATPTHASGPAVVVTAPVVRVSLFSATSGWGSIASTSNPGSFTGVAYTVDGGRTWYNATPAALRSLTLQYASNIALYARSAAEAWTWLASFNGNSTTLWHSTDAGAHWSSYTVATAEVEQLDFTDSLHGWLNADPGGAAAGEYSIDVWRTTDGGATWAQVASYYVVGGTNGISFASATTGFAGGCPPGGHPSSPINLCVTHNAGNTWSAQSSPIPPGSEPADLFHVYAEPPVFISATAGVLEVIDLSNSSNPQLGSLYIYRTTDAGISWHEGAVLGGTSAINVPLYGFPSSVLPTGEVFVAATVNEQMTLYQLPLGTNTWTKIDTAASSTTLLAGLTQVDFVNQMTGWAVTSAGLIVTTDGGVTWAVRHA